MKHALFFFGIPTFVMILFHFIFWNVYDFIKYAIITTPLLFLSLVIFAYGFVSRKKHLILSIAWMFFSIYWATQPEYLYYKETGDIFNAVFCIAGVYFLSYISYHEYLSYKRGEEIKSLDFLAGSSFYASLIYFGMQKIPWLSGYFIKMVAEQSTFLLKIFGYHVYAGNFYGTLNVQVPIYFNGIPSVNLVLACTGLQSMAVFMGIILAIDAEPKRKWMAFLATVPTIYFLNLIRNAGVIYGMEVLGYPFSFMHNVIGKAGSLLALILIAYYVFDILPELYDNIIGIVKLYKRMGPIERLLIK